MSGRRLVGSMARRQHVVGAALLAAAVSLPVFAQEAASSPVRAVSERAQIAGERAAVETRFSIAATECSTHFVVTSCVDDAKRTRRESLDRLRARERAGDDARRQERADERRKAIGDKAADDARRDAERASRDAGAASGALPGASSAAASGALSGPASSASATASSAKRPQPSQLGGAKRASSPASAASRSGVGHDKSDGTRPSRAAKPLVVETPQERKEREMKSRAAYDKRQEEASQHRTDSTTRARQRASVKPPSASLPVPGASAASGAGR